MKQVLFAVLILSSVFCSGQNGKCFNSTKDAKDFVSGHWKIKDVQTSCIYKIVFEGNQGRIEILEYIDINTNRNGNKYDLIFDEKPNVVVEQEVDCFAIYLEVKGLAGSSLSAIVKVSENQFKLNKRVYERFNIND